jgi:methylated-DNA-[protein]-cysteine S-methyltransferase
MSRATSATHYTMFKTAVGELGLGWNEKEIVSIQLPMSSELEVATRLQERLPGALLAPPSGPAKKAIAKISKHLDGTAQDFSDLPLSFEGVTPFKQRVYSATRAIGYGETRSYGELAELAGSPGASRAVGQAMATNPYPIVVPCHRVLAANGKPGGFGGGERALELKARLLAIEGVSLSLRTSRQLALPGSSLPYSADEAVRMLSKTDPVLRKFITKFGPLGLQLQEPLSIFDALARAIIYQQLHGKAAASILEKVKASFGRKTFPTPAMLLAAPDEHLRGAGLSQNKMLSLRDLAAKVLDGTVPSIEGIEALEDEEVIERLTEVRGIGRWTVEVMLIFRLGRPDVLPIDDFGVRKGFGRLYLNGAMPTPKQVKLHGERWRPFRSAASWYLWRAADA